MAPAAVRAVLAENGLLRHPQFGAPVTLADCDDLADDLGEPDGWSVAARFAAEILPGIFRLDDPCLQLRLAPEHRVALEAIVAGLPAEVFAADDSLGWVYQYWQSERKDQVNASEVKIGGANLGPVTQLFTENYMVRFLLENSLGAWWAARRPNSPLVKEFEFLRFDDDGHPAAGSFTGWPDAVADVTVMDPCCGSGHFLVEAFGMLWRMRAEEEGLDPIAAQDAVLRDNLFGLELDPRCVQIAMFAVALTAWKQGDGWRELPTPNIACSGIPAKAPLEGWVALAKGASQLERALERLHGLFKDADTLGSLIDPKRAAELGNSTGSNRTFWDVDFADVAPLLERAAERETSDPATAVLGADAAGIARAAELLGRQYSYVITNPPWLGRRNHSQTLLEHADRHYPEARADLATMMLMRMRRLTMRGAELAAVTPQNWTTLAGFREFRDVFLGAYAVRAYARLGAGAFGQISGEIVKAACITGALRPPGEGHHFIGIDVEQKSDLESKQLALRSEVEARVISQADVLSTEDRRLVLYSLSAHPPLSRFADVTKGLTTGDDPRFRRRFWELADCPGGWVSFQSGASSHAVVDGCTDLLNLADLERDPPGGYRPMSDAPFGRTAFAVGHVGAIHTVLYLGGRYDQSMAAVIPKSGDHRSSIWAFLRSDEYETWVRRVDSSIKVTDGSLVKVPFDLERWRRVADKLLPDGLPKPWSDDPMQWLFEGRPEVATEPLQVAVGRLVGYRWPEQSDADGLDSFADRDGVVCLPAVGGELPAADRLTAALSAAYGNEWSPAVVRRLLEATGSRKKSLSDWLRDDFFKHHCKVFSNRPFVWHVWDERKDGFSALVNYHRLDRAVLEKLTYTYLGDWIERQRADAAEDVAGADLRLAAARQLKVKLETILAGEPPYDIYVRWKELHEQPIGWDPDLDDGVRLNIRPFVEAGVLRSKVNVHWKKDRGKNPDGSERHNDLHYTNDQKRQARQKAGST
ncbi:MAG: BREX-1 system adenine-specific DNA-methyltransferase PglX [Actinomycetota bacterium]|nr:BREX-1 system adenine-specific DNA-methyltransferase PglX [Actinomycetota bacterium]